VLKFKVCVKDAPGVPEGMEYANVGGEKKNPLAEILGGFMKEMGKKQRGRGGRKNWGRRRGGRRGGRTEPVEEEEPI